MGLGGVAIVILPSIMCLKLTFSDGLGGTCLKCTNQARTAPAKLYCTNQATLYILLCWYT